MATVTGEYIKTNKLMGALSSVGKQPIDLNYAGSRIYRAYYNGNIVWDVLKTVLTASDFTIGSAGGNVYNYAPINSYETDAVGVVTQLAYICSPEEISINNTTDSITHDIKVTQMNTGHTVNIVATQSAKQLISTNYGTPIVTSTYISSISAGGGTVWLTVYWQQVQELVYDNGTSTSTTITGSSVATVTGGIAGVGSINAGGIYAPSLGTTLTVESVAYTITSYSYIANGITANKTSNIIVNQLANNITNTVYGAYNLSISANSTATIPSSGDARTIYVTCTQDYTNTWASGSTESGVVNATATVSTNYGTFASHNYATQISITGSGQATLSVVSNTGAARTVVVSAVVGNVYREISILQNAVYYVFTQDQAEYVAGWRATTVTLTGTSTMNGSGHNVLKANVSANNNASVGVPDNYNGTFSVPISIPENSSTSQKTYTVTITQSGSGYQLSYKIYQDGKPKTNKLTWYTATATIRGATAYCDFVLLFSPSIEGDTVTFTIYADGESFSSFSQVLSNNYSSPISGMYGFSFTRNIRPNNLTTDIALEIKATYGSESKTIVIDIV